MEGLVAKTGKIFFQCPQQPSRLEWNDRVFFQEDFLLLESDESPRFKMRPDGALYTHAISACAKGWSWRLNFLGTKMAKTKNDSDFME